MCLLQTHSDDMLYCITTSMGSSHTCALEFKGVKPMQITVQRKI